MGSVHTGDRRNPHCSGGQLTIKVSVKEMGVHQVGRLLAHLLDEAPRQNRIDMRSRWYGGCLYAAFFHRFDEQMGGSGCQNAHPRLDTPFGECGQQLEQMALRACQP